MDRLRHSPTLIERAANHGRRVAIVASEGTFSYDQLREASHRVASALLGAAQCADLAQARVAFLAPPGWHYVVSQWGIWRAGGIAVPLAVSHPPAELDYTIGDSQAAVVLAHPELADRVAGIAPARGVRLVLTSEALEAAPRSLPVLDPSRAAIIFYTSGTTGKPKGAVLTHANLQAQVESLVTAWEWAADDRILGVLPLHHVHGVVNVLTCALWSGATCELQPRFDAAEVWDRIATGRLTLFMAVPTIYARLIAAWDDAPTAAQAAMSTSCRAMRLMVSGSAALPVSVLQRWREISGHTLLERYGMTEIGMALANPLRGERVPGSVGTPLPGVEVRLVDEVGRPVAAAGDPGEIEVRGPGVFREYWNRPAETGAAFRDGWFRTGDVAAVENGRYRILGRLSVDIIKTGGYKVSALEIEEVLREHPDVAECAVVGVPDDEWGERVCAAVVQREARAASPESLRDFVRDRLAPYKVPSRVIVVGELPRNAMGKVTKAEVVRLLAP
ncbi:MAG: AMP-binding protein [Gemmatimonadetes bacterium]|nr:AMP-binding protein [Gemmatimonadota bacterium]